MSTTVKSATAQFEDTLKVEGLVLQKFGSLPYDIVLDTFENFCLIKGWLIQNPTPSQQKGKTAMTLGQLMCTRASYKP
jgi:hypothetical protein